MTPLWVYLVKGVCQGVLIGAVLAGALLFAAWLLGVVT